MITLTTPTGRIGSKLLQRLLDAGAAPLRVIVRDAGKLPAGVRERVETVEGDLNDPLTLQRAFTGACALFWCQPDCPTAPDYVGAYRALAAQARDAVRTAGVSRVVAISAAGAPRRPAGPITALHQMEAILRESGAACRFLHCGSFFENLLWQWEGITQQGVFAYSLPGDIPSPHLATADIAAVAARWLADAGWEGVDAVPLLGPHDLSYDQMAAELTRQLHRPVRYEALPAEVFRDLMISMGQSPDAAQGLVDMFAYLEEVDAASLQADRSLTPTTFSQWLEAAIASRR